MPDLIVEHLAKEYPTRGEPLVVLRDVSIRLSQGENLAIVGPSGWGKSTLLHIVGRCHAYASHFDEVFPLPPGWERVAETDRCACAVIRHTSGRAWGIQPHPEIDIDEGRALQASYLQTMPERREVLEAAWHATPRDDRIAAALVEGFLSA